METWQRDHIQRNLSKLVEFTIVNVNVKAFLLEKDILSKEDIEKLVSLKIFMYFKSKANHYKIIILMAERTF